MTQSFLCIDEYRLLHCGYPLDPPAPPRRPVCHGGLQIPSGPLVLSDRRYSSAALHTDRMAATQRRLRQRVSAVFSQL